MVTWRIKRKIYGGKMKSTIKVVLNDFVEHLGAPGDQVEVARGYARNYLLPKKLAFEATAANMKTFENNLKQRARKLAQFQSQAEAMKQKLEALDTLTFERKSGDEGKLFGSVTNADIETSLKEKGFQIERKQIVLKHPIKSITLQEVPVKIHSKVTALIKVEVVAEKSEQAPEEVVETEVVADPSKEEYTSADLEKAIETE